MAYETATTRRAGTGFPFLDMMFAAQGALLDLSVAGLGGGRPGNGARSTAVATTNGAARAEQVIPLAEEVLNVEARKVSGNTVRVRRYVVETPVERRVALRDERVVVERRRPAAITDTAGNALTDITVEATETSEVPVVWKGIRVKEEIVLRLEATERTETVRDTVRRDEVDIQQPTKLPAVRDAATREAAANGAKPAADGNKPAPPAAVREAKSSQG